MTAEFNNIKNKDLAGSVDTAWNKLYDFVDNFSNVSTYDPFGV